ELDQARAEPAAGLLEAAADAPEAAAAAQVPDVLPQAQRNVRGRRLVEASALLVRNERARTSRLATRSCSCTAALSQRQWQLGSAPHLIGDILSETVPCNRIQPPNVMAGKAG